MKTRKKLEEENSIEVGHGYNICREDVLKLINESMKKSEEISEGGDIWINGTLLKSRIQGK